MYLHQRILRTVVLIAVLTLTVWRPDDSSALAPTPILQGGGGTLNVALRAEPKTLNPDLQVDDDAFIVSQNIYNKLVTLDIDYQIIPDLATSWEIAPDGLTYTFHLAEGVRWHDGTPFSSADVQWTLQNIVSAGGVMKQDLASIESIETPDAQTVVLHLSAPFSPLMATLAWYGTFILPKHLYDGTDWTTNPANDAPVGTGPFKFKEWTKGEQIVLEANPQYFRDGPFLDRVVYTLFPDQETMKQALIAGEIHFTLSSISLSEIDALGEEPGVQVDTFPIPSRYYMPFNLRRPPLDDVRVRRAINAALNRTDLVNNALAGYGIPGVGFYTPAIAWAYNGAAQVPPYDPAAAEVLLDEAGLPRDASGVRLTLNLVYPTNVSYPDLALEIQAQLQEVGIAVTLEGLEPSAWSERVRTNHDFDMALIDGSQGPDPHNMRLRFGADGVSQVMGYSNPELDVLLEQGAATADTTARAAAYFAAQAILANDLPIAPLAEWVKASVTHEGVTGWPWTEARGLVTFNDFSLVQIEGE